MQVMTGKYTAALSPSSMQAGNTTAGNAELTQTAPGSLSVLPVPDKMDVLPMPRYSNDSPVPVSHPGQQQKTPVALGRDGAGPGWKDAHSIGGGGGGWTEAG